MPKIIKEIDLKPIPRIIGASKGDDIYCKMEIGNDQAGSCQVEVDGRLVASGHAIMKPIGKAENLANSEIITAATVVDYTPYNDMAVVSTKFINQNNEVLYSAVDSAEFPDGNGEYQKDAVSFFGEYKVVVKSLLILFFISVFGAHAQTLNADGSYNVEFDDLQTPASPGFALLDETPESIARPTTPQGLAVGLMGLVQGTGAALEVAPFWLKQHVEWKATDQMKVHVPFGRTFSASVATVNKEDATYVSGGVRFRLFQYFSPTQRKTFIGNFESINGEADSITSIKRMRRRLERLKEPTDADLAKIEQLKEAEGKVYEGTQKKAKEGIDILEKPTFSIDFAAALAGGSETDSYRDLKLSKWSAWLSANVWLDKKFSATFLVRYIDADLGDTVTPNPDDVAGDASDFGLRLNWDISEKFCLSGEYIQRIFSENDLDSQNRFAAIGSYKLLENLYATATFGKNFGDVDNIIALGGINIGLSQTKQVLKK